MQTVFVMQRHTCTRCDVFPAWVRMIMSCWELDILLVLPPRQSLVVTGTRKLPLPAGSWLIGQSRRGKCPSQWAVKDSGPGILSFSTLCFAKLILTVNIKEPLTWESARVWTAPTPSRATCPRFIMISHRPLVFSLFIPSQWCYHITVAFTILFLHSYLHWWKPCPSTAIKSILKIPCNKYNYYK